MNPATTNKNSNFNNGTEENATCSSPDDGRTSAEDHGPVSLAQTMYDEFVGSEFVKDSGGDSEASKPMKVAEAQGPVVSEISATQSNEPTEDHSSCNNLYKELTDSKATSAGRVLEERLSTTTSLASDWLLKASQQGDDGSVLQNLQHRPETSTSSGLETIEASSLSLTNSQFLLQFDTSMPEARAELIDEGDVSYESAHCYTESTHYNTAGVSGERQQTQPESTPETAASPSKRRLWISVGIAAVVAAAIAIVLGLTLPKSAFEGATLPSPSPLQPSGFGSNSPSPSPLQPSSFTSLQSKAELLRAVDDYLSGGEQKALAASIYGIKIESWNVSDITNFDQIFSADRNPNVSNFNEPLSLWDVSKATSMREMFLNAAQFDQPLKAWNVSSVVDMTRILSGATSFRQNLCEWRKVLPMSCSLTDSMQGSNCVDKSDPVLNDTAEAMFCFYCSGKVFQDRAELLAAVDVYLVDRSDTSDVAAKYGHPIGTWQVSRVTDFSELFSLSRNALAVLIDEDISGWDTSAARTFQGLFRGGGGAVYSLFNKPLNDWSTGSVTDMSFMFAYNSAFNQSLAQWNTAKVTTFSGAFEEAHAFNQPLNDWNTSSATNMNSMFLNAWSFNQRLDSWDVGNVREMGFMFAGSNSYNQPMDHWNVLSATNMRAMFDHAQSFNQSLCSWLSQLSPQTDVSNLFVNTTCPNESSPDLSTNPPTGPMCAPC